MSIIKDRNIRLALLGAPNCGKTSLFNALTGGRAKVANYPGVTVEFRKGNFSLSSLKSIELLLFERYVIFSSLFCVSLFNFTAKNLLP